MEKAFIHKVLHRFDPGVIDQVHNVLAQGVAPVIVRELV